MPRRSTEKPAPVPGTFHAEFIARLNDIEARAKACGVTLTHLCRDKEISRATPERWRLQPPKTIDAIDQLEDALRAYESAAMA